MSRSWRRACLLVLALMVPTVGFAQSRPTVTELKDVPKSFLFVGNSFYYYNNSLHSYFLDLARKGDPASAKDIRGVSATTSGSGLNWHDMEGYFGKGMASYSFDEANNVVFNRFDKQFDVVVMNDCSQCPIHPQLSGLFKEYVKKHGDTVRAHGAVPVLFMTWAYQDKPEMTAQLAEAYTEQGNQNGMLVIPAGLAFAEALAQRPGIALYQPDKRHPTREGTYLAAATAYATIYGRSPLDNPAVGLPAIGTLDPETAGFLRSVAWKTVTAYLGRRS